MYVCIYVCMYLEPGMCLDLLGPTESEPSLGRLLQQRLKQLPTRSRQIRWNGRRLTQYTPVNKHAYKSTTSSPPTPSSSFHPPTSHRPHHHSLGYFFLVVIFSRRSKRRLTREQLEQKHAQTPPVHCEVVPHLPSLDDLWRHVLNRATVGVSHLHTHTHTCLLYIVREVTYTHIYT